MNITLLEHVNIHSTELEHLSSWYEEILGLKRGYRPPFGSQGAWLYAGDIPMVHLLEVSEEPESPRPGIEHFCMRAQGLSSFIKRLKQRKIVYQTVRVPELRIFQIHLRDPEGNHMHIDFAPEEADDLGL